VVEAATVTTWPHAAEFIVLVGSIGLVVAALIIGIAAIVTTWLKNRQWSPKSSKGPKPPFHTSVD
jgi:hypothetical protein